MTAYFASRPADASHPVTGCDPVGNNRQRAQACKTSISAPIVRSPGGRNAARNGQREILSMFSLCTSISPPLFREPLQTSGPGGVASCRLGRHPVVAPRVTVALGRNSQLAQREMPRFGNYDPCPALPHPAVSMASRAHSHRRRAKPGTGSWPLRRRVMDLACKRRAGLHTGRLLSCLRSSRKRCWLASKRIA